MAGLLCFAFGCVSGWFVHQYRERIFSFKAKVERAVEEEFRK